ncbi:FliO/MopB family protein [Woodsholea maritima]|uniref:FliO/MopB family protein n=1 Tax=Woodsholea maritima TaxID=240237 RepID=UPI00037F86CB|nr:flagellar biosynthetic protein FliO [Woodsholea maritima]
MDMLDLARYIAGLLIILGLLAGFAVALRLMAARGLLPGALALNRQSHKRMAVRESLILDPRRRVVIVQIDDREHILLLGQHSEQILAERAAPIEPDPPEACDENATPPPQSGPRPSFSEALKQVLKGRAQ